MTTLTATDDVAAVQAPIAGDPTLDDPAVDVATSAVQDVLDAEAWPARPTDMWTRVQRDRALARFAHLKVLVTDHGCVVARTPARSLAGADAGRERWPPSPAAA